MPPESIKWFNSLIYGEPGAGKTHLIGTAAEALDTSPVLLIDIDGGGSTLKKFAGRDIDVVRVPSFAELDKLCVELRNSIDPKTGELPYKTLGIDSSSEAQKLDMAAIMREVHSRKPDQDVPSQREWGICLDHMRAIVRAYRDLPCHTIFTCHVDVQIDQRTNAQSFAPALSGKSKREIAGFLDIVGFMRAVPGSEGKQVRQIQFASTPSVPIAKDRTGLLGDVLVDPSIPLMWDLIHTPNTGEIAQ